MPKAQQDKRTLFASRKLVNGKDIVNWAKAQGFKTTLQPDDMHATLIYSKEPFAWPDKNNDQVTVGNIADRSVERLGDQGATVLRFKSPVLGARHDELKAAGAQSDYPSFTPHVTVSWNADDVDLDKVEPYRGPLIFGPERFQPVDPDWSPGSIVEKREPNRVILIRAIDGDDVIGPMLRYIGDTAATGHSFNIVVDPDDPETERKFSFDGDGADRILSVEVQNMSPVSKAGARHNAKDRATIQAMHDHATALGAICGNVDNDNNDAGNADNADTPTDLGKFVKFADAEVAKIDEALGMVFGFATVSKEAGQDYFDVQDDHIPEASMIKAAADFMMSPRIVKEMHSGDARGQIVFAFPLTTDIAKALDIQTERTGLIIGMKPDAAMLAKFVSGELTGFSIGGRRVKDETIDA